MTEVLQQLTPPTSTDLPSAISSPESEAGHTRSDSPDGPTADLFGQPLVRASRSHVRGRCSPKKMSDTCGRPSIGSPESASLQLSLANRLQARLRCYGSMEYSLTWKQRTTPAGRVICALRASGRRTSDKGFTGWPSPRANKWGEPDSHGNFPMAGWVSPTRQDGTRGNLPARPTDTGVPLSQQAILAGWRSPDSNQRGGGYANPLAALRPTQGGHQINLEDQAVLAGWVSPSSRDWKDSEGMSKTGTNPDGSERNRTDQLPRQAQLVIQPGQSSTSSTAPTGKRGALNPAHSRWLMGYPVEWDYCGATAMQSCRNLRRNSSKPISKSNEH